VHFEPDDSLAVMLRRLAHDTAGIIQLSLPTPELRNKVMRDLAEMCDVGSSRASYRDLLAFKLLETALVRCLSAAPLNHADKALDPRLKRALDLLSENLTAPFDSAALARACGLSERQMFRFFAEQTDHTPRAYLEICRMARARYFLRETTLSVAEIGEQIGFESSFYFTTRFKIHTGMSPSEYRRKFIKNPRRFSAKEVFSIPNSSRR
jgi:AraC family transcriptional regulator of arabinose operon